MPSEYRTWIRGTGGLFHPGLAMRPMAPPVLPDSFIHGVTVANATNTGPRVPEIDLSNYAGSFTNATAGSIISKLAITGQFDPNANNVTLVDSLIMPGTNPGSLGTTYLAFRGNRVGITGTSLDFVRIRPSVNSVDHYGVQGRDFILYRTDISGVVDGVVASGYAGYTTGTVQITDSFIHGLQHFAVDPRQSNTPSHDDGVQAQGGITLTITGSTILGGFTSAILITHDTGLAFTSVTIEDNPMIDIENPSGGAAINVSGTTAVNNLRIVNNKFGRTVAAAPRLLVSTASRNATTTVISGNVYADNGAAVATSNGG